MHSQIGWCTNQNRLGSQHIVPGLFCKLTRFCVFLQFFEFLLLDTAGNGGWGFFQCPWSVQTRSNSLINKIITLCKRCLHRTKSLIKARVDWFLLLRSAMITGACRGIEDTYRLYPLGCNNSLRSSHSLLWGELHWGSSEFIVRGVISHGACGG